MIGRSIHILTLQVLLLGNRTLGVKSSQMISRTAPQAEFWVPDGWPAKAFNFSLADLNILGDLAACGG